MASGKQERRQIISWMLYDCANSAFATTVLAGFFPVFFKKYWAGGMEVTRSSAVLGAAHSIATLAVLLIALLLGAYADRIAGRKKLLLVMCLGGSLSTCALAFVNQGNHVLAIIVFIAAVTGFLGGNIFYDSLLPVVVPREKQDIVSAGAFGLGYLGGGILFLVNVTMYLKPGFWGLGDQASAIRVSFFTVGLWWILFTVPLMLSVKEDRQPAGNGSTGLLRESIRDTFSLFRKMRRNRNIFLFLLAFWLYNDAISTVIKMAVAYGSDVGIEQADMIKALLLVQFVGFPAAWIYGKITVKAGRKRMLLLSIGAYVFVVLYGALMKSSGDFYILAVVVALFQGGIQAISRSMYASLIPAGQSAKFFGLYNVGAHFSTMLGPVLVGLTGHALKNPRAGLLVLEAFLVLGAIVLMKVKEEKKERHG
ncbi:MAG: MFS transporter [Pseudomonadota bacterium]